MLRSFTNEQIITAMKSEMSAADKQRVHQGKAFLTEYVSVKYLPKLNDFLKLGVRFNIDDTIIQSLYGAVVEAIYEDIMSGKLLRAFEPLIGGGKSVTINLRNSEPVRSSIELDYKSLILFYCGLIIIIQINQHTL